MNAEIETLEFQAEARQLLQLMVHSIYSNKDIFLRELISNASDALDKLRWSATQQGSQTSTGRIFILTSRSTRSSGRLTVRDNGVGMSREEVVRLIGTIARSGTAEFLQKLEESKDAAASRDLIGQFGVGFYSSFMVADKVTLLTRRAGRARRRGGSRRVRAAYTIESVRRRTAGHLVTLHLKPEDVEDQLFDYTAPGRSRRSSSGTRISSLARSHGDGAYRRGRRHRPATVETLNSMKALWARPRRK